MPTLEPNLARGRALQLRSPDHSDHLAQVVQDFANQLKLTRYSFFLQDYVGPIGFRMANAHPEMIDAIVFQNANAYEVGLSPLWPVRRAFWEDRPAHEAALRANFISREATRQRHVGASPHPTRRP